MSTANVMLSALELGLGISSHMTTTERGAHAFVLEKFNKVNCAFF